MAVVRTRRAKRISVSVRPSGEVRLTIPYLCPVKEGIAFLESKSGWVDDAVARMKEKHPCRTISPPYFTAKHELVFVPARTDKVSSRVSRGKITVTFPDDISPGDEKVQKAAAEAILRALKTEAKETLPAMVGRIASEHGFRYRSVTVRTTRSRWGSCSSRDDISLSVFLMRLPDHLIEYIILHELCHTKYRDHSGKFHELLDRHLGGREKEYIKEIRAYRPDIS